MNIHNFSDKDLITIEENGLTAEVVNSQLLKLRRGNIPISLVKSASLDNGILHLSSERREQLIKRFDENSTKHSIVKFVPASGVASRMFSQLSLCLENLKLDRINLPDLTNHDGENKYLSTFFEALKNRKFAFYDDLGNTLKEGVEKFDNPSTNNDVKIILEHLLGPKGLNYNSLPKALIKFHKYSDMSVSPIAEHFLEAIMYSKGINNKANIHFTINKNYLREFTIATKELQELFNNFGYQVNVDFSFQSNNTNTISIQNSGDIVRNKDGNILLRAGGHGSLLENLGDLKADIIFIKNIDNIIVADRLRDTIEYKKVLCGFLLEIKEKIFSFMDTLSKIVKDSESINEIFCFSNDVLNISFPSGFVDFDLEKKKKILNEKLNKPIRICGMVRNKKEPGGGPFWIYDKNGDISLQIVEKSQIDTSIPEQSEIFNQSSYFNPVDIVCSIKNYHGDIFHLKNYVEDSRYFISEKNYKGEQIKIIEHPGLWNGSMEKWISIFVEIPSSTFNPVKHVNDLLKDPHIPAEGTQFSDLFKSVMDLDD